MAKPRTAPGSAPRKKAAKKPARSRSTAAAKPAPASPAAAPPPEDERSRERALVIARAALEKKALDVTVLDVRGLASYAEYFVLMTAESEPQLNAIADNLEEKMKELGERPFGVEGARGGRWVLIDFGDVVAHVFYQDAREFYDLEGLWADARRLQVVDAP